MSQILVNLLYYFILNENEFLLFLGDVDIDLLKANT